MQHHKKLRDLKLGDLFHAVGEENGDPNMSVNLLTVASTGNATFLEELLKARFDPDIGDAQGRTPLVRVHSWPTCTRKRRFCVQFTCFLLPITLVSPSQFMTLYFSF